MAWTERQHALLNAMGLRLWSPPALDGVAGVKAEAQAQADATEAVADAEGLQTMPAAALQAKLPADLSIVPSAAPLHATAAPLPALARGDLATLDWPGLRQAVAGCTACGLCSSRQQTVFGAGHQQAHWMVVGEAPGEQEDLQGEPFVGPSGQLLDRMLAALRLSRGGDPDGPPAQRVYIANTLKCRPPRNRNPSPAELAQCEPFLVRQIELLRPRMILAMGRFAVQALLRSDEPVGKLRGRVHRYQGVPLVVTYHPAYLLRNLPEKAKAWEDLCLAADAVEAAAQA
jgi:DNA polymerase